VGAIWNFSKGTEQGSTGLISDYGAVRCIIIYSYVAVGRYRSVRCIIIYSYVAVGRYRSVRCIIIYSYVAVGRYRSVRCIIIYSYVAVGRYRSVRCIIIICIYLLFSKSTSIMFFCILFVSYFCSSLPTTAIG
jgi:hypothetical protein